MEVVQLLIDYTNYFIDWLQNNLDKWVIVKETFITEKWLNISQRSISWILLLIFIILRVAPIIKPNNTKEEFTLTACNKQNYTKNTNT